MNPTLVVGQGLRSDTFVELVGIGKPRSETLIELFERLCYRLTAEPQMDFFAAAGWNVQGVVSRCLSSSLRGVHRLPLAAHNVLVKRVFHIRCGIRLMPQASGIALVLGEEQLRRAIAVERVLTQVRVRCLNIALAPL